jgi:hypothetical protein
MQPAAIGLACDMRLNPLHGRVMALISETPLARAWITPVRSLVSGAVALGLVAVGLQAITAEETSFYRSHAMVPDARTATRLAELVLADHAQGCPLAGAPTARLDGDVWTVEGQPEGGTGVCRVLLARKDGQVLKVDTPR